MLRSCDPSLEKVFSFKKWFLFLLGLGVLFIASIHREMIETYYTIPGTVTSEGVVAVIPIDHLPKLLENDQVMIDRAHYKYRVLQILDDVIVDKDRLYRQVLIDVLLPLHLQVENNTFSMQIPLEKKFILKIIESCWKEE